MHAACATTDGPGKLAELIVLAGEARGVRFLGFEETSSFPFVSIESAGDGIGIETVHVPSAGTIARRTIGIPEARLLLCHIMTTTADEKSKAQVEALFRGEP
jgi:hypothetical protein